MSSPGVPTLLGIPFDGNSSYLRGGGDAPGKIREALRCEASNSWTESGVDLSPIGAYDDAGDLSFGSDSFGDRSHGYRSPEIHSADEKNAFPAIEAGVSKLIESGKRPVLLGGDHSITYPILKAFVKKYSDLTIFHFDAHPDLYDEFEGNRLSHACPFARIMEDGLAKRLVQVGIRTMVRHQREQAEKFGVEVVEMHSLPAYEKLKARGPIYVSFDIDVLDPAFAPGVSHREPGGMSVREAIAHLQAIEHASEDEGKSDRKKMDGRWIVGADIVEYNPVQDFAGVTAIVAAKILKEILGKMIVS